MAYLLKDPNTGEEQEQLQQPGPVTTGNVGAGNPNGGQGNVASSQQLGAGSNRFANIQQMISQNQSAPNVAGKLRSEQNQAANQQNQQINTVAQQVKPADNFDQSSVADSTGRINNFQKITDTVNAQYKGPQAGSIDVAPQNLNTLTNKAQALKTSAGQKALLQDTYKRPSYTSGQQSMDNLLMGRNSNFQKQSLAAQNLGRQLEQRTQINNEALNRQATAAQQQTELNKAAALKYATDESAKVKAALEAKVAQFNQDEQNRLNDKNINNVKDDPFLGATRQLWEDHALNNLVRYEQSNANLNNIDPTEAGYFNQIVAAINGTDKIDPATEAAKKGKYSFDLDGLAGLERDYKGELTGVNNSYMQDLFNVSGKYGVVGHRIGNHVNNHVSSHGGDNYEFLMSQINDPGFMGMDRYTTGSGGNVQDAYDQAIKQQILTDLANHKSNQANVRTKYGRKS